jgi:UDP-N-acetylmuramyl pentapeptide phosphotransferase/UDP-N-acetylglucosamine-1-phosphate transferase
LLAFLASYLLLFGFRSWALRSKLLDIPNARSLHSRPVARGGGLAIVLICLAGFGLFWELQPAWGWSGLGSYIAGASLIAVVSGLDDLRSLPFGLRFGAHSLAAALTLWGFGPWSTVSLPWLGSLNLGWLGLPISFLWIVGLTNAYNFMDGIDGLAGGQAVVAGLGWIIFGWLGNQPLVFALALLLAGSSLGFLGHNWQPARIFMGDVGRAFLGYTFAVLAVAAAQPDPRLAFAGFLLVWPFVFDPAFTFVRRLLKHENVLTAHRSHLYQRLVLTGLSHQTVAIVYIGLAGLGAVCAVSLVLEWRWASVLTASLLVAAPLALWQITHRRERVIEHT